MIGKKAEASDFDFFYELRCDKENIRWSGHADKPDKQKLYEWYLANIGRSDRIFFLFFCDISCDDVLGYLYLDITGEMDDIIDIGYGVHHRHAGKGFGSKVLQFGIDHVRGAIPYIKYFQAWVAADNVASIKTVLKTGYHKTHETKQVKFPNGEDKLFEKYILQL